MLPFNISLKLPFMKLSLHSPASQIVKLEFSDFNIEQSSTCVYDSVTIYDGENKNSPKLGTYCGGQPEPIDSTGKYLLVEFTSDSSVRKRGFSATYTAVNVEEGEIIVRDRSFISG